MFPSRRILEALALFTVLLLGVGCGGTESSPSSSNSTPKKVLEPTGEELSGKVTYKGMPVTGGTIKLIEPSGKVFEGHIRRDGSYRIHYLTLGEKKVTIETESIKHEMTKHEELAKNHAPGQDVPPKESVPVYVPIPTKYGNAETSSLSVTIKKGENTQDFDLED